MSMKSAIVITERKSVWDPFKELGDLFFWEVTRYVRDGGNWEDLQLMRGSVIILDGFGELKLVKTVRGIREACLDKGQIVISDRSNAVALLKAGADDVVGYDIMMAELGARFEAIERRYVNRKMTVYELKNLILNYDTCRLTSSTGYGAYLSREECGVLALFMRKWPDMVYYHELGNRKAVLGKLRKRFEIVHVYRKGYRIRL